MKPSLRDHLHRYWFRFEADDRLLGTGTALGCGATALDRADAEALISDRVFGGEPLPPVLSAVEDVDVRDLDQGHVIPNMGDPSIRGVWFPPLG